MKTLIENYKPKYCSKTIMHSFDGKDVRFKIVAKCGNCYSELSIEIQTPNNDFKTIATKEDIPNYDYVDYVLTPDARLGKLRANIKAAEDYILKVF